MMLLILLVEFLHLILRQHLPCFWDNLFKLRPLRRGLVWITDVASTDVTEETEEIVLVGGLVSPIRRRLDDGRAGIDRVVYRTEELETFRSEERRVGKECVRTFYYRGSLYH